MTPRVLVADASPCLRLALRGALATDGINLVDEVATAPAAYSWTVSERPDVVLLDHDLDPRMEIATQIAAALGDGALVVLSSEESATVAEAAVRAGASGLLPKSTPPARLPAVIRGVLAGEAAFPRMVVRSLLAPLREALREDDALEALTARERQVLELLSGGHRDHRVAASLGLSPVTVRRHVATAKHKLRARGRTEALAAYREAVAGARA